MENENKRTVKEWVIRIVILLAGLTIAHLGVTLFLLAELGSDPFNVLVQGLFRTLSGVTGLSVLTHGRVHIAVCFIIIIILLFVDRSYIKVGTVICMFCGGPIIDFFTMLLTPLVSAMNGIAPRVIMLMLGCVILAYGMTIVIKSDAGTGPNDLVAIVISDKLNKRFSIIRIIVDVCFVVIGWLLGGIFGAGTVICAFLVGPVAGFFLPVNGRIVERILGEA
ncbi:MAG TPA: hypothetical protein DCL38_01490 [Lachnospiraceae bacterium]|nr:hypothetical protein [Lachnospiraceae bacterium]